MERETNLTEAKAIMGSNFIGPVELTLIADKMGIIVSDKYPNIPFRHRELIDNQEEYILILGTSQMNDGKSLTLKSMRERFGVNPEVTEPCFYNQDWYLNEKFIVKPLETKWFLIRKNVIDESRGKFPQNISNNLTFPSAVICAYLFFANWFYSKKCLWEHDFVWCNDLDHNGDRIYVGKYNDIEGINKKGFSIHRHLSIQSFYGAIDIK